MNIISDPYFITDRCVDRLYEQWKKTPKICVAVDFDDTLFDFHQKGFEFNNVIDLLKECQKQGFYIVIYTASAKERHAFIVDHMTSLGIKIDAINKNVFESQFGNDGKIFYNIFLDDRAGLLQAFHILHGLLTRIKTEAND